MKVKRNTLLLIAALVWSAARQFDSHYAPWGMGDYRRRMKTTAASPLT